MYCATSESADLRLSVADILSSMANGVPEPPATTTVSDRTAIGRSVSSGYARACARRCRYFHRLLRALGLSEARRRLRTGLVCCVRVLQRPARHLARPRLEVADSAGSLPRNDRFSSGNGAFVSRGLDVKTRL
ncbi:hypothetical protein MRX96_006397 [Rhipicephalus microplus]